MGGLVGFASLMFLLMGTGAGQHQPRTVVVPQSSFVKLWSAAEVTSATAKVGDDVMLYLPKPLVVDGETVLPAGYVAHAIVTEVAKAGPNCQDGVLRIRLEQLHLPDSVTAKVRIFTNTPDPNYESPKPAAKSSQKQKEPSHVLRKILLTPVYIALSPVIIPVGIAGLAIGDHQSPCTTPGQERVVPAKSTFMVQFLEDQRVSVSP